MRNARMGSILFIAFLLPLSLSVVSCSRSPEGVFPYDAGVIDLRDTPSSLAHLKGKPAVVVMYVASMPDCRKRIERFVALSDAFRSVAVRFVAVDISVREMGNISEFLPEDRGNVLFLKDRNKELERALKVDITPTTFLVSADGKIRNRIESVYTWDSTDFRDLVDALVRSR